MNTWSNFIYSQPLTTANIQIAVDKMLHLGVEPIVIRPDVLIVPPGLIENAIHVGRLAIEHLVQMLAQPVKRGRFEQRQRRKAHGVWAMRLQRRQRLERAFVEAIESSAMFEREYEAQS